MTQTTAELLKALEDGNYNARPSKLRQGGGIVLIDNGDGTKREPTEAEWDVIYEAVANENR